MATEIWGTRNGINLDNIEETSLDEINTYLNTLRMARGPLDPGPQYEIQANAFWFHTRPDFAKLQMRITTGWGMLGLKRIITASSIANMHTYINQAWPTGIENCMRGCQVVGVTKDQLLEAIMHAQLSAGMRALGVLYQAIGIVMNEYQNRPEPADWPEGWAPDMDAFYCGLDKTTRDLTPADKKAIEDWYEKTLGEVPLRIQFLAKHDPHTLKGYRARWEGVFRGALPKQMFPYLSIRHNTVMGDKGGLREAVLLARAWGMTKPYIVNTIIQGAYYFNGLERLDKVEEFVGDLLDK
jgi:hypothetical protein